MSRLFLASFNDERDLLRAVEAARRAGWAIVDAYVPYAVHGLHDSLGWRRSRLPAACFFCGLAGAGLSLWLQFWTTTLNWPLNVGGHPWNSLPAFVPVTFEAMVLSGGFGLAFAWMWRCRLYLGKPPALPIPRLTDDCFALVLRGTGAGQAGLRELFRDCHLVALEEREAHQEDARP